MSASGAMSRAGPGSGSSPAAEELLRNPDALSAEAEDMFGLLESKGAALDSLRREYEQMYDGLQRSIEGGAVTERKVEEINAEIAFTREQVSVVKRLTEESKMSEEKLATAMQVMKSRMGSMQREDEDIKKQFEELQEQVADFRKSLQRGSGWTEDQLKERAKLQTQEENITRNSNSRMGSLMQLRNEVAALTAQAEELEAEKAAAEAENDALARRIRAKEDESTRVQAEKTAAEHQLLDLQVEMAQSRETLKSLVSQVAMHRNAVAMIEKELQDAKLTMERYLSEYDCLFRETERMTEQLEMQVAINKHVKEENAQKAGQIQHRRHELKELKKEARKLDKLKKLAVEMLMDIEGQRDRHEKRRDELKHDIAHLIDVEIRTKKKECDTQRVQIDELKREREVLNKKLSSSEKSVHDVKDIIMFNQSCMKVLQNEITGFQNGLRTQRDHMNNLLHDKEKHEAEAEEANRKYFTALEQLKLQDIQIRELQKQIVGCTARLKQQQNLYETVRSDRNLYSKQLLESQQEIDGMKSRFKIMNHQIEQLKEEIIGKDHALVKEHFNHHSVDKEKEALRNELTKIRKQIYSSEQMIHNQRAEIQKLNQIIQEAEDERLRQNKEYESVICERDILGGQLIKRNDELHALYERVRLQRSSLGHGEYRYQKCLEEIAHTNDRFSKQQTLRDELLTKIQSMNDLKQAVIKLESDLLHERSKIKALSDEQETTLNVHRWRILESSDPQRYEMTRKIHGLQQRIIARNQDIIEKDMLIQEKEKIYVELKNILARQPGPEVAQQLDVYQENLKMKNNQLRTMDDELSMYKEQVEEFRSDIARCDEAIVGLKRTWLSTKRGDQKEVE